MKFRVAFPASSLYPGGVDHWWKDVPWSEMVRIAKAADDLGFDALHVSEHIVMHEDDVQMMGPRWVHTVTTLGFLAGATKNIKLVGLIVVPYHHPVELAKMYSTLDQASEGRAVMGAAVGYMEWEYRLMGATWPYSERGKVTDEYMEAMIELWTAEKPSYYGKYVSFDDIVFDPKPYRDPHPLIWFAGTSKPAVRRAARFGNGWYPNTISRAKLTELLGYLHEQPGYDAAKPFDVFLNLFEREMDHTTHTTTKPPNVVMEKDAILEQIAQLSEIGVTITEAESIITGGSGSKGEFGVKPVSSVNEFIERLHWFAEEIFPEGKQL